MFPDVEFYNFIKLTSQAKIPKGDLVRIVWQLLGVQNMNHIFATIHIKKNLKSC